MAAADEVHLKNGDRITCQLQGCTQNDCVFSTPYQASLTIPLHDILRFSSGESLYLLEGGEALRGRLELGADGAYTLFSTRFGQITLPAGQVFTTSAASALPIDGAALLAIQGTGTEKGHADSSPPNQPEILGQALDEDYLRELFRRESSALLQQGQLELSTGLHYASTLSASSRVRGFTIPLGLGFGLSRETEVGVEIPFKFMAQELFQEASAVDDRKAGFGDLEISVKHWFLKETSAWPDLIAALTLTAPTGNAGTLLNPRDISLGNGHWSAGPHLSFIKSSDPAILYGGIGYTYNFSHTDAAIEIRNGAEFNYNFGLGLAFNQSLSLSSTVTGNYGQGTEYVGIGTLRSTEPISLNLGMTYRLNSSSILSPSITFGLNDDAPDSSLGVTLIYRR